MTDQEDLFSTAPARPRTVVDIAIENGSILSTEFLLWLPDNLHVWDAFVKETFKVIERGRLHYSSVTIIEFLRHYTTVTEAGGEWKINNNFRPYLPRLFDIIYPQHAGLFEYRYTTKPKGLSNGQAAAHTA